MRFMNYWDIDRARERYADHPVLGPATETLANVEHWADMNSDGWAYWPKPARACARLMELIERERHALTHADDVTVADYKAALRPVKAFRTRHGADFTIVEA